MNLPANKTLLQMKYLALDGGRIIEDGTYDALIEKGGSFAELVERQRMDTAG